MVGGAALVLVLQTLLGGLLPLTVDLDDALGTELHIRMDEDLQAVGLVLQDVIGAAADDDAGAFFGQSGDDLILVRPENVLVGGAEHPVGEGGGEETAGGILTGLLHIVR